MKKKIIAIIIFIILLLIASIIGSISYYKSIPTMCNNDLPLISEAVYRMGDYNPESDLVKEIEKNSDWNYEEVNLGSGHKEMRFIKPEGEKIFKLTFGGKSGYLGKKYKQEYLYIQIFKDEEILYSNSLINSFFVKDRSKISELDDSEYYTNISNDKLKEFIMVYKEAFTDTYCK